MLVIAIDVSNNDNFTGLSRTNITTSSLLVEHCIGITEVMVQLQQKDLFIIVKIASKFIS